MPHFDTSSRQLELVDRFYAAYRTRDVKSSKPLMAKDYKYKTLPEIPDLPEMTKEQHFETYDKLFAASTHFDVGDGGIAFDSLG